MIRTGKARIIALLFILVAFSNLSLGSPEQTIRNKNILILFSQVPNSPAYKIILDGIRTKLTEEFGDSYNLHTEYLETEYFPRGDYPRERFSLYNEKYKTINLDLLICVGYDIISTIKIHADSHLLQIPTVSIDWDLSNYNYFKEIRLNEQTAEIGVKVNLEKTFTEAMKLFPDTRSIYFFCGVSNTDRLFYNFSKEALKRTGIHQEAVFITDTTMDDALKIAHKLPDSSLVIIPYFNSDIRKVYYYNHESIRLISLAANAPVFGITDIGLGEGAVGGYIISFEKIGLLSGENAVKILNGADPNSIQVTEKDYYEYAFDWRQLKRWNMDDSNLLPQGSTILYRETSVFRKYQWIIYGGILFLVLQTFLIANLARLNRKQKMMTLQIIDAENKYRELIREDRILRTSQLTASLSHELNQPLTAILSTAQAGIRFIDSNKATPALMKELLQNIVEDDKRTASILSSIRGMMKLERRKKEKVSLNEMIEELLIIYNSEAIMRKIKIEATLADEHVLILADRTQIQQVIMNFILNAFQSMARFSQDDRTVSITESTDNGVVTVSVRDHGSGIDDSIKDKIFKPFVTSKKEGMGIGLALSHSIIQDHQGRIWAENMPDGGARFSFSLKIARDGA